MQFGKKLVTPNASRKPFFDGMDHQTGVYQYACVQCKQVQDVVIWDFIVSGNSRWKDNFSAETTQAIIDHFQLPFSTISDIVFWDSHEGGSPFIDVQICKTCGEAYLVYVGFYEKQPQRYLATIQGVTQLVDWQGWI